MLAQSFYYKQKQSLNSVILLSEQFDYINLLLSSPVYILLSALNRQSVSNCIA